MRRYLLFLAAGVGLAPTLGLATAKAPTKEGTCGKFGTSVEFVSTPSEAARQAKKDQKLVLVLHVSGHFEDPNLT